MDFHKIEEIYSGSDFHNDSSIANILQAHRNIENCLALTDNNLLEGNGLWIRTDFHQENVDIIDYLILNLDAGYLKSDAVIYLYSCMICRYSDTFYDNSAIITKYQELMNKWILKYSDVSSILEYSARYFSSARSDWSKIDLAAFLASANDNNYQMIFHYCRFLIYDKNFCKTAFVYQGNLHRGAYVIFDVVMYNILTWRSLEKEKWIDGFIGFFERNKEIQFIGIDNYYLILSRLYKCKYLSSAESISNNLKNELDSIVLPEFETNGYALNLYVLYSLKLIVLEDLGEQQEFLDVCDYMLDKLDKADLSFIKTRLNWRKDKALWNTDKDKHREWYFDNIKNGELSKSVNYVYCSPFMKRDDNNTDDLFHFSDLKALESIIENGQLWLTRHDFLNDTEEVKYIREIVETNKDSIADVGLRGFIDSCISLLDLYFNPKSANEISDEDKVIITEINKCISSIYILSTSIEEDNLSLWHYYSGGTGCSIKINATKLRNQVEGYNNSIGSKSSQIFMREVDYSGDMKNPLIDMLKTIYEKKALSEYQQKYLACVHIIYEGIFTKNPNMRQEKEFRMAVIASEDENNLKIDNLVPKFRVSKNTFIPYVELKIAPRLLIEEICIAPLNKTDIAKKGLEEFLKNKNFDNYADMVVVSGIKLRY